jgi:AraC family transcriptional regulator
MGREESLAAYRGRIARALDYVRNNLTGELSLDGAAEAACFSKYHFHRIFSAMTGEPFSEYVRRLRLERAALLLESRPEMTVTEAAMACGFGSPSVLSRDFAARFGVPPSRWRDTREGARSFVSRGQRQGETAGADPSLPGAGEQHIIRLPAFRFVSIMHYGGYGRGIDQAWRRLFRWAGPRGIIRADTRPAGIAWDNPDITPHDRCRYSACLPAPPGISGTGEVVIIELPARTYLSMAYRGPSLSAAYTLLYSHHLPESGFEPEDGPAIEFYAKQGSPADIFDLEIDIPVLPLSL